MMLSKAINEEGKDETDPKDEEEYVEEEEEEENSSGVRAKKGKKSKVETEPIRNIVNVINDFVLKYLPKYRQEAELERAFLLENNTAIKLI